MPNGQSILVTGGTGSFGRAFVSRVLNEYPDVRRLVVFSRDELKQHEMAQEYSVNEYPSIRYFLGDVRDRERLRRAFKGIDIVIHAAALKQVPAAEYNPMEFVHTNIFGAANVIEAALDTEVKQVIALSTDKASAPINFYGATKLCSDKLFVAANYYGGNAPRCSVVRYGNVMGSRGSVIPLFLKKAKTGVLPVTSLDMTRFSITLQHGVNLVLWALENSQGGEIFVPKIPTYKMSTLVEAIGPSCEVQDIGIRPGEKLHEELITVNESCVTVDLGENYAILPAVGEMTIDAYTSLKPARPVGASFSYNSAQNSDVLSVDNLRDLIRRHVDPSFEPA